MTASDRDKPEDTPERFDFEAWAKENVRLIDPEIAAQQDAERHRSYREARLKASGIDLAILPDEFEWVVQDKFPIPTYALQAVQRWEHVHGKQRFRPFSTMVLTGMSGVGKTVAGAWLIAEYDDLDLRTHQRASAFYATCETLRQSLMSRDRSVFERACTAGILVADELGTEDDERDSHQRMLYQLVNRRSGLSTAWTLFISNNHRDESRPTAPALVTRYDARTIAKIEQRGMFVAVPNTEPNLRKRLEDDLKRRKGQQP